MDGVQRVPAVEVTKVEKCTILKDVVAFVDVKTAEGDEAGGVFVDILRGLGARVGISPESFGLQG
jgi:3-deoxy-D-arabino-heptulosonate 7-phosphate (DAHP) synthase class II